MLDIGNEDDRGDGDDENAHVVAIQNALQIYDLCGPVVTDTQCCPACFARTLVAALMYNLVKGRPREGVINEMERLTKSILATYDVMKAKEVKQ